ALEGDEHLVEGTAERALDGGHGDGWGEGGNAVLQQRQLVGDVRRHQVAPRRQDLAELHEDRAEALQRQAQAHAAWRVQPAPEREHAREAVQPRAIEARQDDLVEPMAQHHPDDGEAPQEAAHGGLRSGSRLAPWAPTSCRPSPRPSRAPAKRRSASATRPATEAMACAGASPITRARSSSTSQRTLSTTQLISAASCTSPSMRMVGRSPAIALRASDSGEPSDTSRRRSGTAPSDARSSSPAGVTRSVTKKLRHCTRAVRPLWRARRSIASLSCMSTWFRNSTARCCTSCTSHAGG